MPRRYASRRCSSGRRCVKAPGSRLCARAPHRTAPQSAVADDASDADRGRNSAAGLGWVTDAMAAEERGRNLGGARRAGCGEALAAVRRAGADRRPKTHAIERGIFGDDRESRDEDGGEGVLLAAAQAAGVSGQTRALRGSDRVPTDLLARALRALGSHRQVRRTASCCPRPPPPARSGMFGFQPPGTRCSNSLTTRPSESQSVR